LPDGRALHDKGMPPAPAPVRRHHSRTSRALRCWTASSNGSATRDRLPDRPHQGR